MNNRRRFSKRNSKRGPTTKALDRKIKKIQRDIELKYIDTYVAGTDITTTAAGNLLNGLALGTAVNTRIGSMVTFTSLQIRMAFSQDPANLDNTLIRVVIFWDRQPNGAAPTFVGASDTASVLDTTTITDPLFAPINWNYSERYRILTDKLFTLDANVVANFNQVDGLTESYLSQYKVFKKKIRLSRQGRYDGSAATIAEIATNSLYIMYVGDVAPASTNPVIQFGARVYYKDS